VEVLSQMINKTKERTTSRHADSKTIQDTLIASIDDGEVELEDVVK